MRPWGILLLCVPLWSQAEEFSFDLSSYEKKPYEWGGYLELTGEHLWLNQDAAFYNLNFADAGHPDDFSRYTGALELEGLFRFDRSSVHLRTHAEMQDDYFGNHHETSIHELYYAARPNDNLTLEIGKRVLKWGKGYAWSPVGFVERAKDPNDPDLTREGFIVATADYVRSFDGPLKTLAFTPVVLPVTEDINEDFSRQEDLNLAAKLYLLYYDTDIDFLFLTDGSSSGRVGLDFSRNLAPNFEIHGELAYIHDQRILTLDAQDPLVTRTKNVTRGLLGLRYLTQSDITWIVEYYHNGAGYSERELKRFLDLAKADPTTSPDLFTLAEKARRSGYGASNPGRDYLYLRASMKEPFDVLYLTTSLTSIINLHDQSVSLTPEVIYTGIKNTEARLRLGFLEGTTSTEFGEKQNEFRMELRVRYFF